MNQRDKNLTSVQDFDAAIKELEERTKRLNEPRGSNANLQDRLIADVDSLQNQILSLHNINEDRSQMLQMLDNRDSELRAQHIELQSKLSELQTKKMQIDQLVTQLQTMEDAEEDDVGKLFHKKSTPVLTPSRDASETHRHHEGSTIETEGHVGDRENDGDDGAELELAGRTRASLRDLHESRELPPEGHGEEEDPGADPARERTTPVRQYGLERE